MLSVPASEAFAIRGSVAVGARILYLYPYPGASDDGENKNSKQ